MNNQILPLSSQYPTNFNFGSFFAALFATIAAYTYWKGWFWLALMFLLISVIFITVAMYAPVALTRLNQLWYDLGLQLGAIVSPIVLALIFFILITPISLFLRLIGRDELKLKKLNLKSYWVVCVSPNSSSDSFKKQF